MLGNGISSKALVGADVRVYAHVCVETHLHGRTCLSIEFDLS